MNTPIKIIIGFIIFWAIGRVIVGYFDAKKTARMHQLQIEFNRTRRLSK